MATLQSDVLQALGDRLAKELPAEPQAVNPEIERTIVRLKEKEFLQQAVQTLYVLEGELRSCLPSQTFAVRHVEDARTQLANRLNEVEPVPIIPALPPVTDPKT